MGTIANSYKPSGYHRLARLMTADNSLAIFRRFDYINAIGLLSLQAEITDMQSEFSQQCRMDDASTDLDEKAYSKPPF